MDCLWIEAHAWITAEERNIYSVTITYRKMLTQLAMTIAKHMPFSIKFTSREKFPLDFPKDCSIGGNWSLLLCHFTMCYRKQSLLSYEKLIVIQLENAISISRSHFSVLNWILQDGLLVKDVSRSFHIDSCTVVHVYSVTQASTRPYCNRDLLLKQNWRNRYLDLCLSATAHFSPFYRLNRRAAVV